MGAECHESQARGQREERDEGEQLPRHISVLELASVGTKKTAKSLLFASADDALRNSLHDPDG